MIRYLLRVPREDWEPPNRPRQEVGVSIAVDGPDQVGDVSFDGEPRAVEAVREALFHRATGFRGVRLEERTSSRNLADAMASAAMTPFAPETIAGGELFDPPAESAARSLRWLGHDVAALFADILPRFPAYDFRAVAQLIEQLRLILARGRAVAAAPGLPPDATAQVAAAAHERLAAAGVGPDEPERIFDAAVPVLEEVVIVAPQTQAQIADVLQSLVTALKSPEGVDFRQLMETIEGQWAVPGAPETPAP